MKISTNIHSVYFKKTESNNLRLSFFYAFCYLSRFVSLKMIEIQGLSRKIASLFNVKEFNVKNTVFKFSFLENTEGVAFGDDHS